MADPLVDELRDLAGWIDVPEAPDLRARVRSRLEAPPPPRLSPWWRWWPLPRRWLAAVAAVAVAFVIAVVPPARAAVVDAVDGLLRFAGVEIRDEPVPGGLPATPSPLPSVRSADLDEARRLAKFPVKAPVALGVPERVEVTDPGPDGAPRVVTMSYRGGTVRVDQFDGTVQTHFLKSAPDARFVEVKGDFAVWLPGPHPLIYVDRTGQEHTAAARLAGPTLIWTDGAVTCRVEGVADLAEAIAIADSMT